MRTTQRISVRDLVEFLLRSGDLDRRQSSGRRDAQAMQAGSRIHRTYRDLSRMEAPVEVHLAQAKCYAYIYGQQHGQMRMGVRMIYADLETEELRYFEETYTMEELSGWFRDLMAEYGKWVSFESLWQERRAESLKKLIFPFDYREGQKDLAVSVYRKKEEAVYPGSDGCGKDTFGSVSGTESYGRRAGEPHLLSDSENDHADSGGGRIGSVAAAGHGT